MSHLTHSNAITISAPLRTVTPKGPKTSTNKSTTARSISERRPFGCKGYGPGIRLPYCRTIIQFMQDANIPRMIQGFPERGALSVVIWQTISCGEDKPTNRRAAHFRRAEPKARKMRPCKTCLAQTTELIEFCPLTEEHCEFKRRAKRARKQAHIVEKPEEPALETSGKAS
jgi:hypothetical protein